MKTIYTVSPAALLTDAAGIESAAVDSLPAWSLLGQADKYAAAMNDAAILRRAAGEKSAATRREVLRNNGFIVKMPRDAR